MRAPTIVCATDLTEEGGRAVDLAAAFARALNGRVVLLHVTDAAVAPETEAVPESMAAAVQAMEATLQERLAKEAAALEAERARCASLGVSDTETVLDDGRPAEAIERAVREQRASLVVLGRRTRQLGYVGPTIHHVVRHASCPVAVAPPEQAPPRLTDGRWVVAIDFSRQSDVALCAAAALVRACGGELVLTNVVRPPGGEVAPHVRRTPEQLLRADGNRRLAERLGKLADDLGENVRAVQRVTPDRSADALIASAVEVSATAIIAGTHGRTGLARLFVGDTADRLLHRSKLPILLVREIPSEVAPWFTPTEIPDRSLSPNHVLVAVDFSDASRRALESAQELAARLRLPVDVVYVHEPPTDVRRGLIGRFTHPTEPPKGDPAVLGEARRQLELLVADVFRDGAPSVTTRVEVGRPVERILAAAADCHADLVVVGTTGRSGIEHVLLGSVAESLVRQASVPVLTLH